LGKTLPDRIEVPKFVPPPNAHIYIATCVDPHEMQPSRNDRNFAPNKLGHNDLSVGESSVAYIYEYVSNAVKRYTSREKASYAVLIAEEFLHSRYSIHDLRCVLTDHALRVAITAACIFFVDGTQKIEGPENSNEGINIAHQKRNAPVLL
jgi:hypothetical protein